MTSRHNPTQPQKPHVSAKPINSAYCIADDEAPAAKEGELDDKAWRAMEREAEGMALGNGTEHLQEVRPCTAYTLPFICMVACSG